MKVSGLVMEGFSRREDVEKDMPMLDGRLALERSWYESAYRYPTNWDILRDAEAGKLTKVVGDENIKPPMRFLNHDLHHVYPPYLLPYAAETLQILGRLWREEANTLGVHPDIRLSVTSLTRSEAYQKELVAKGKLAVLDSTHLTGATFDLDLGGYRIVNFFEGRDAVVSLREPARQETIAAAFKTDYGAASADAPIRLGPEMFDHAVPQALMAAATILYEGGLINMVPEMVDTPNCALHISVAPPRVLMERMAGSVALDGVYPALPGMLYTSSC
jgi:hypothetical protein